mmetsp:Transcript_15815/g.26438  ORF Transcript_15815/g.26438 Transcript_15815/m.26438 type:complete len:927 (+) Transcript_15815:92-2872(+)
MVVNACRRLFLVVLILCAQVTVAVVDLTDARIDGAGSSPQLRGTGSDSHMAVQKISNDPSSPRTFGREEITHLPLELPKGHEGEDVTFGLFDGSSVTGTIKKVVSLKKDSFLWSGSLSNGGTFYVSYVSGAIVANLFCVDVNYEIRPVKKSDGEYLIREIPNSFFDIEPDDEVDAFTEEGAEVRRQEAIRDRVKLSEAKTADKHAQEHKSTMNTDTNNIIDVMVVYSPQALTTLNEDTDAMDALIQLAILMSNEAYENSNIDMRMRLVAGQRTVDPNFVESDFSTDLGRLRDTGDGVLDEDMNVRMEKGADAVVLITSNYQYCGIGYLWADTSLAVSLISVHCPQSLAHEVGHNVGAHHDRANAGSSGASTSAYNFGWCWDSTDTSCKRTVMAYYGCTTPNGQTGCPRDLWFSTPSVLEGELNQPVGDAGSDNARVHNEEISRVINWVPSLYNGGLVLSLAPDTAAVDTCTDVVITGWRMGTGSDITSVTLGGYEVDEILSQTMDSVIVRSGLGDSAMVDTAVDVVITSSGGLVTTLESGFTYTAGVQTGGFSLTASNCSNSPSPTAEPTFKPTLGPGESYPPTEYPTSSPSEAQTNPPTSAPTKLFTFPHETDILQNTNSARQNYVSIGAQGCPGDVMLFSTCSVTPPSNYRDTYIRLYEGDVELAYNDDYYTTGGCSELTYTVSGSACTDYVLRLGCWSSRSCTMTATLNYLVPTASPTYMPSVAATTTGTSLSTFNWGSFDSSNIDNMEFFAPFSPRHKKNFVGATTNCNVLDRPNYSGKWYLQPLEGLIATGEVLNGYGKFQVKSTKLKNVNSGADTVSLAFGRSSGGGDTFQWTQNTLTNSRFIQFKNLDNLSDQVRNTEIEMVWQLDFTQALVDASGVSHTFASGASDYFLEIGIMRNYKSGNGGVDRMCIRVENLEIPA